MIPTAFQTSSANNSGSSNAAKWPPRGMRVKLTRFVYFAFNTCFGVRANSFGKTAQAAGAFVGMLWKKKEKK